MKITAVETLRADAGWRMFSFLKVMTDSGIVGWSEYNESFGSPGLSGVIETLVPLLIGQDPRRSERISAMLHVHTRQSQGGLIAQAIAAIENALLDIRGKELGVPVYALFGGPVRDRIPVYWSHMGTYRVRNAEHLGVPPLLTYEALAEHAAEIKARGFKAMKTNTMQMVDGKLAPYGAGFGRTAGLAGAELGQRPDDRDRAHARRHPRGRRRRYRPDARHELPLQDRGLRARGRDGRAVQADMARDRHA